jgi:hypothetical protein
MMFTFRTRFLFSVSLNNGKIELACPQVVWDRADTFSPNTVSEVSVFRNVTVCQQLQISCKFAKIIKTKMLYYYKNCLYRCIQAFCLVWIVIRIPMGSVSTFTFTRNLQPF